MIARFLARMAVVWVLAIGGLVVVVGALNGTLAQANWLAIGALVLGPAAIALSLAWVFALRQ